MYIFDEEIQVEHGFREIIKKVLFLTKHNTDYTEVSILNTKGSNVTFRHNTLENIEFFNTSTLSITVFKNHRQGNIFSTDLSLVSIKRLVDKVIQLSQHTSFDKYVRLPNKNFLAFYPKLINLHFFLCFNN
ncbi:hypothetical protein HIC20_02790 [Buchnera aphidicola (Hormaphis cornu)]|nr:hypothetical protein HIC20_02790 [Buchnera aphidicola (Hormaphis cornu)]